MKWLQPLQRISISVSPPKNYHVVCPLYPMVTCSGCEPYILLQYGRVQNIMLGPTKTIRVFFTKVDCSDIETFAAFPRVRWMAWNGSTRPGVVWLGWFSPQLPSSSYPWSSRPSCWRLRKRPNSSNVKYFLARGPQVCSLTKVPYFCYKSPA